MNRMTNARSVSSESGFTLVELAIVLVIIGLIIGGVLVGQDMIRSAEIRSTIGQWEKYNSALNTFRDKFGGYPGDLRNAQQFGFFDRASATVGATTGDGNGLIEDCAATPGPLLGCETAVFFEDLAINDLIAEEINATAVLRTANHTASDAVDGTLPEASMGRGNYWSVYFDGGRNWFHLGGYDITGAGPTATDTVDPITSYNIDNKIDDAVSNTGIVLAVTDRGTANIDDATSSDSSGDCLSAAGVYNTDEDDAGESVVPSCQLMIRMQ